MGKKFVESKVFNIGMSILVALGLWFYVTSILNNEGGTTLRDIPVTVVGEDVLNAKGLMIDPSSKLTVNIGVTGGREALMSIAPNVSEYFAPTISVTDITEPGIYDLPCTANPKSTVVTMGVRQSDKETKTVRVIITKLLSKSIPIKVVTGSTAEGFRANSPEVTPETVSIQGPETIVSQVDHAEVAIPGDDLTKTFSGELGFRLIAADGEVVEGDEITANVSTVNVVLPVVKTLEVPLDVEFIYGGGISEENFDRYVTYEIEPQTIQISGDAADVAPLEGKSILLPSKINLADVTAEGKVYHLPIVLTSELSNDSGISEATVTVTIKGLETKTLETSNIEIIHVPEGFTAEKVTQTLRVTIRGPADVLENVDEGQLRVVVDLEGENLRQAQFPFQPRIYLDGDSKCGVVSSSASGYIVVVNIQLQ